MPSVQAGGEHEPGRHMQSVVSQMLPATRLGLLGQVGCWGATRRQPWALVGLMPVSAPAGEDRFGRRVITFSCCRMPPSHELNHRRLLQ